MNRNVNQRLHDLIAGENYSEADRVLDEYLTQGGEYDDMLAVCDGRIGQKLGDSERVWAAIRQGLCFEPGNYELYMMLGDYYLNRNLEQSWLCYEYALALCEDRKNQDKLRVSLEKLAEGRGNLVGRIAVVIWCHGGSGFVRPCVESVRRALAGRRCQIVAVAGQCGEEDLEWLGGQQELILVNMETCQDMSQVWEKGIAAAWTDANCLLMDSDMIVPEHALFWLEMALYSSVTTGTAGSMSGCVTHSRLSGLVEAAKGPEDFRQLAARLNVPTRYPWEVMPWTKGAAVLIRRQVLNQVGVPREGFAEGVFMDRDYGRRVNAAGYRNLLCENSFLLCQQEAEAGCDMEGSRPKAGRGLGAKTRRFLLFYAGNENGYYQDTKHFTEAISRELDRRGHEIFICDLPRGSHDREALKAYEAAGVDAVLTFNGEAIEKEGQWRRWNQLGALVVNILMDPPYHIDLCPYMEHPDMEQYLLLCPDENHVAYVKSYFPQVKHVEFMPHGGTPVEGRPIPWKDKPMDLLFCGIYIRPEEFLNVMSQTMTPEEFRVYTDMGERLLQDSSLSVEQLVTEARLSGNRPLTPTMVDEEIPKLNLLEGWVRMVARERAVTALVEGGVELNVLGAGWQDCPCAGSKRLHSLSKELIPFPDTLAWIENAKINLNVMPWFKAGSHDRVFNAMLRESVALTDPSTFFRKHFQDRESVVYYSQDSAEMLPEIVRGLLKCSDEAELIARTGYEKAAAFTWESYVEELLAKIERCLR